MKPFGAEIELLKGKENYKSWSRTMELILKKNGLWKAVVNVKPETMVDRNLEDQAFLMLGQSIEKKNYELVSKCDTAGEVWNKLKIEFEGENYLTETRLLRELCDICRENCESIEDYCELIENCSKTDDQLSSELLLNGLLEEMKHVVKHLASCSAKMSAEEVKLGTVELEEYLDKVTCDRGLELKLKKIDKGCQTTVSCVKLPVPVQLCYEKKKKLCWKCREEGHLCRECPLKLMKREDKRCWKCNELSHLCRDCPLTVKLEGIEVIEKRCWKCRDVGHLRRQCPQSSIKKYSVGVRSEAMESVNRKKKFCPSKEYKMKIDVARMDKIIVVNVPVSDKELSFSKEACCVDTGGSYDYDSTVGLNKKNQFSKSSNTDQYEQQVKSKMVKQCYEVVVDQSGCCV